LLSIGLKGHARELDAFQPLRMTLQGPLRLDWASPVKLLP